MRRVYIFRNGKVILRQAERNVPRETVYVISDTMPTMKHMATGKYTDSKSRFRRMTKDSGCIELGNSQLPPRQSVKLDRRQRRDDIRRAISEVRNGR